jgi:hypothetical protein
MLVDVAVGIAIAVIVSMFTRNKELGDAYAMKYPFYIGSICVLPFFICLRQYV